MEDVSPSRGIRTAMALMLSLFFIPSIFAASVQLKVSTIDNQAIKEAGVGQPFALHVIVNNASNTAQYPVIKNVEKYSIRRTGFQMNMVNGDTSTTYTYQIRIDEPGTFTLGPAHITENNSLVESEPITIHVSSEQKYADAKRGTDAKSKASFLRLTCNKERISVGERAQCTLTFYTADQMVSLQSLIEPDQSSLQSFSLKNKMGPITGNETINGIDHRYAQWKWDIYPTKAGNVVIPAYAIDYNTQTNNNMFSFFFAQNNVKRTYSNTISLNVDALPASQKNPVFIGTISGFSAKIEPAHARVGEGMVLALAITGDGDFDMMPMPPLTGLSENLKWYESKHTNEPSKIDPAMTTHSMEYIVQALQPGDYQIPAQEITYFDTRDRAYKTRKTNELSIHITGSAAAPAKKIIAEPEIAPEIQIEDSNDIKPIAQNGPWVAPSLALVPWPFFWILMALLSVAWLLFILLTTNQSWLYRTVAQWNAKASIYAKARKQIKQAHNNGNYASFYTIFITLLSTHYAIEPAALSPEVIELKLASSGLSAQAIADWKLFFTKIAESGFYKKSEDPYFYSHLYDQALYWVDIIEKLPRKEQS